MNTVPDIWRTESNPIKQTVASAAFIVIGAGMAIGFRIYGAGLTGDKAGFLLGLLLLVLGLVMLLLGGKQAVTVDAKARRIVIESKSRFSTKSKEIRFEEIADASLGELGDREGGSISYHVVVKLKRGGEIALFKGFFDGAHDKSAMEARREQLLRYLQSPG